MLGHTLRHLRKTRGFTQAYIAQMLNISPGSYGRYETDDREPDIETLTKLASLFGITLDELITGVKQIPDSVARKKGVKIPVLGRVVAGIPIEAISEVLDYEEIPESMAASGEYFALIARGSSMNPTIIEGDVLIIRKQTFAEEGRASIVLVNGSEATVKRIHITPSGITLIADNPSAYAPHFYTNEEIDQLPVKVIGRVVEIRRKMI